MLIADGTVDAERYSRIARQAVEDVYSAMSSLAGLKLPDMPQGTMSGASSREVKGQRTDVEEAGARVKVDDWYRSVVDVNCALGQPVSVRLAQCQFLIDKICAQLGYTVTFIRIDSDDPWAEDLKGFVSWLFVLDSDRDKLLLVVYNTNPIEESALAGDTPFSIAKVLEKIFLHECGHAVLHLRVLLERYNAETNPHPSLDPQHEQDAWFYAEAIFGVLAGDHARWTRASENIGKDLGWQLA